MLHFILPMQTCYVVHSCKSTPHDCLNCDPATTEIYTLSLHDALPIYVIRRAGLFRPEAVERLLGEHAAGRRDHRKKLYTLRSEEHTSELQSRQYLVCRLLLEKKKECKVHTRRHQTTIPIPHETRLTPT